MSGPIVRSGPSPEFSKNWESVFGKRSGGGAAPAGKTAKKSPIKKAVKKPVAKKAKKSKR